MDWAALDTYLEERAGSDLFSGTISITRGRDQIFAGAYGLASRAWDVPNSPDIRFDTASITKLFTAVVALQTVETGRLDLETRPVDFLDLEDTTIHPDATLRQLLTHTSGIGDDADEEAGEDYADIWQTKPNYLVRETTDLFDQFIHKPPNFAPGEGCRYCNVGFVLAGAMAERATGSSYRDLVSERVFAPAGMVDSGFFAMDEVVPRVAEGADQVDGVWMRNFYSYPPIGSPDGGAHCTVGDLLRFLGAVQDGLLLGPEMTTLFLTPQHEHSENEGGRRSMGFGLEFQINQSGRIAFYEKEGINAGTSGFLRHYPATSLTVAMLSNMADGVWEPRRFIHSLVQTGD